jgi:hypothetical protein
MLVEEKNGWTEKLDWAFKAISSTWPAPHDAVMDLISSSPKVQRKASIARS